MKNVSIIGVPMSLGQMKDGVDLGPKAIRYAGLHNQLKQLNISFQDKGDISFEMITRNVDPNEKLKNIDAIIEKTTELANEVDKAILEDTFPFILGGDHSIAMGTLAGLAKHYKNLGVIWYDAHGDLNTKETTPSGNIHGMPLAASLGIGEERLVQIGGFSPKVKPENIVLIGIRDLDEGEKELIKEIGIKVYTMQDINKLGMKQVMEETINYLKEKTDGLHLSLDLDGLDPSVTPGVGTAVPYGISLRESELAMEMLHESNLLTSLEVVEVNPLLDEKNKTAEVAVHLISRVFGEKLL